MRRERNAPGVALPPLDLAARLASLVLGERQRLRVGIEPDDLGRGLTLLQLQRERPGAAAEVEHLLAGLDVRGIEQARTHTLRTEQPRERVVEAQEAVVTRGGDVVVLSVRSCVSAPCRWR